MKKNLSVVFALLVAALTFFGQNTLASSGNSAFHISQLKNGSFEEVFTHKYSAKFTTENFELKNLSRNLTLKINEFGDLPYSGMDSAVLNACGQKLTPISAFYADGNKDISSDILSTDLNVVVTHNKPIQISWDLPQGCSTATLSVNANEYDSGLPFHFPSNGTAEYQLGSNSGSLNIDGKISETDGTNPIYIPYWYPSSGHPNGSVYIYAKDDADFLYFATDLTIDNTDDIGPDWISINIGNKKFKVMDADATYGKCAFGLTSKVSYKHQTCELKIPKSEINNNQGVSFALEYYGTASEVTFSPSSAQAGGSEFIITFESNGYFNSSSTVRWNESSLVTTFVSSSMITALVPATNIRDVGSTSVDVMIDPPRNISTSGNFTITSPFANGTVLGINGLDAEHAYTIETCEQLQAIGGSGGIYLDKYFKLDPPGDATSIDCGPDTSVNTGALWNNGQGFDPIGGITLLGDYIYNGYSFQNFTGVLDGQNNKITNLYINRGTEDYNDVEGYYVGLFSTIASGARVENLGLEDVDITGHGKRVGALAGGLSGTITNVYSTGKVHGYEDIGGLVGVHVGDGQNFPNSSPLVYTWDGEKYKYTDDVGSILPKELDGLDIAQIDSKDIAPKDGKYSMKIAEEYNEIVYYDELALMTFDHQPGYSVVEPLDRSAGVNDLRTVKNTPTNPLISCVDNEGRDCLDTLKSYDDKWSYKNENNSYDKKNLKKYWILDFGNLSNASDIELVLRGARDYAASAENPSNSARSIQVKDSNGKWVEIYNKNQLGSDGSPRLRTINLTGKFLSSDHYVKVAFDTFNANYFAVDTSPQVAFTTNTYHPDIADLGFHGFTDIDRTYYFNHDYSKVSPFPNGIFKNQYGNFTKYGDVKPLLSYTDDHFVVMRYGDQLSVEFPYVAPVAGMERSFMVYNYAYYKHATNDNLGVMGQSAGYLPYKGMTKYSPDMQLYPQTPENIDYMNIWNTRNYPGPFTDALRHNSSTIINSHSSVNVTGTTNVGGLVGDNYKKIIGSYATGVVTGYDEGIGGLLGRSTGNTNFDSTVSNSYATGHVIGSSNRYGTGGLIGKSDSVSISNTYATGVVDGGGYTGGLIGQSSDDTISDSYATGTTTGSSLGFTGGLIGLIQNQNSTVSNSYATGNVTGNQYVGGLVGSVETGNISNSYATGNVTASSTSGGFIGSNRGSVSTSYSIGSVTASGDVVGGFIGYDSQEVHNSFSTGEVTGGDEAVNVGGFVGQSEAENNYGDDWWFNNSNPVIGVGSRESSAINHAISKESFISNITYGPLSTWHFFGSADPDPIWYVQSNDYPKFTQQTVFPDPTCSDGIQNQNETSVDAGGICSPTPIIVSISHSSSGGSSIQSRVNNLISMGNTGAARDLMNQYSNLFTSSSTLTNLSTSTETSLVTFARNLTIGSAGQDVKSLQQFLNAKGFVIAKNGPGSKGKETNKFGPATKSALIKFQKANKILPATGNFGPKTRAFIGK